MCRKPRLSKFMDKSHFWKIQCLLKACEHTFGLFVEQLTSRFPQLSSVPHITWQSGSTRRCLPCHRLSSTFYPLGRSKAPWFWPQPFTTPNAYRPPLSQSSERAEGLLWWRSPVEPRATTGALGGMKVGDSRQEASSVDLAIKAVWQ